MSYSLNSLKGGYIGEYIIGVIKGDTRSLHYSSFSHPSVDRMLGLLLGLYRDNGKKWKRLYYVGVYIGVIVPLK